MKKKIIIAVTILLFGIGSLVAWVAMTPKSSTESAYAKAVKAGKVVSGENSYNIDPTNLQELAGQEDYIFVGKVIKDEGLMQSSATSSVPFTTFKIKVIQNIKGQLSTSKPIKYYKLAGSIKNGYFFLEKGDIYPEKGNYYIFTASTVLADQPPLPAGAIADGGVNTTILLDKSEAVALKSSKVKDFQNAVANQVPSNRERGTIVDSEVYLNEPLDQ